MSFPRPTTRHASCFLAVKVCGARTCSSVSNAEAAVEGGPAVMAGIPSPPVAAGPVVFGGGAAAASASPAACAAAPALYVRAFRTPVNGDAPSPAKRRSVDQASGRTSAVLEHRYALPVHDVMRKDVLSKGDNWPYPIEACL